MQDSMQFHRSRLTPPPSPIPQGFPNTREGRQMTAKKLIGIRSISFKTKKKNKNKGNNKTRKNNYVIKSLSCS